MLFSTVVSEAFDQDASVACSSLAPPSTRPAAETLALYARALDDMRAAYAQVSVDYAGALQTASALRATLLRADMRIRRDACRPLAARIADLEARVAVQAATICRLQRSASRRGARERTACVARA